MLKLKKLRSNHYNSRYCKFNVKTNKGKYFVRGHRTIPSIYHYNHSNQHSG